MFRNMKRRNTELTKNRKCPKRSKYGDGSLGVSIFLAAKLLVMWIVIVALDFATGFRLEYMYPCWLMVQSVIDAYKYQGVGFTVFFISMVVTSDILVYMFVPTTAMFFLASLYVWIQLMMHSGVERGICVQTVVIWMVFLYLEATMRLRELKLEPSSSYFTWDICRPFAAHCVGYPLVTFSFSVKSFIGFKYRKHKQLQIAAENRLFRDLINGALPEENRRPLPEVALPLDAKSILTPKNASESNGFMSVDQHPVSATGGAANSSAVPNSGGSSGSSHNNTHSESRAQKRKNTRFLSDILVSITPNKGDDNSSSFSSSSASSSVADSEPCSEPPVDLFTNSRQAKKHLNLEIDNCDGDSVESEKTYRLTTPSSGSGNNRTAKGNRSASPSISKAANFQNSNYEKESVSGNPGGRKQKGSTLGRDTGLDISPKQDDLYYSRLEGDMKRLRTDLQGSRQLEQDLRGQLSTLQSTDKSSRSELVKLQQENESLQQRLNNLVAARQQDKQNTVLTEKRLNEEKKARLQADTQLALERKQRKAMEDAVPECSAACKQQRKDMDTELRQLRRDLVNKDEKMRNQGEEIHSMKQRQESSKDADMLSSALSSLQDKNAHLENSLGQETKLKLDLFSALGEAKRQLEISQNMTTQRDKEISELKQKISRLAEVMTLLPSGNTAGNQGAISALMSEALKHQGGGSHRGMSSPDNHIGGGGGGYN